MDATTVHMMRIKKAQQPRERAARYSEHLHSTATSFTVWNKTELFMQWNTLRLAPADSPCVPDPVPLESHLYQHAALRFMAAIWLYMIRFCFGFSRWILII
ncbi:hypothetical protein CDAR_74351 [Caerostris darwini]|uniref:Uncharacterized protein n=1 Tax=Caerostris darwini TaxID=1538125 RepID=A0AAV4UJX5_9ARAC|nr:hypothetical protein CDAR_74351 [Caerostris darwini]